MRRSVSDLHICTRVTTVILRPENRHEFANFRHHYHPNDLSQYLVFPKRLFGAVFVPLHMLAICSTVYHSLMSPSGHHSLTLDLVALPPSLQASTCGIPASRSATVLTGSHLKAPVVVSLTVYVYEVPCICCQSDYLPQRRFKLYIHPIPPIFSLQSSSSSSGFFYAKFRPQVCQSFIL